MSTFVHGWYGAHLAKPRRRRRRVRWSALLGPVAAGAGHALRAASAGVRYMPGLGAGVALVVSGFVLAPWVGWGVVGVVLLALDRRIAARRVEASAS